MPARHGGATAEGPQVARWSPHTMTEPARLRHVGADESCSADGATVDKTSSNYGR